MIVPLPDVRVRLLPAESVVLPLRDTAPVPVESVPEPDWVMLLLNVAAPVTPSVPDVETPLAVTAK